MASERTLKTKRETQRGRFSRPRVFLCANSPAVNPRGTCLSARGGTLRKVEGLYLCEDCFRRFKADVAQA